MLSRYDSELIREVTDPNTGISTSEKYMSFMPNAGELKVYCDGVAARRARMQHLASVPALDPNRRRLPPPAPRPGDMANVFVPATDGRYERIVAMAQRENERLWSFGQSSDGRTGIWVAHHLIEDGRFRSMPSVADLAKQATGMATEPLPEAYQQEAAE